MEGDENRWSPYQSNIISHPTYSYSNSLPVLPDSGLFYGTNWPSQVGNPAVPHPYITLLPTYDHAPPNVNPFSSSYYSSGQLSDNPDAEVCYYSRRTGFEPSMHFYDERRCSSTDTTVSSSSVSTVFSHSSIDMDTEAISQQGSKRKRKSTKKTKNSKAKTEPSGNSTYKRWPKPPYSYCGMIMTVIQLSPKKELTLQEIHAGLMELFPFFRGSYVGWRDSVRHNLSHNSCFVKTVRNPPSKSCLWKVDWTKVTPAVFARQQSRADKSDIYKPTIQEHLGLPPFAPEAISIEDAIPDDSVPNTPRNQKKETYSNGTPQMCDTRRFNVTLPIVETCENQGNSPFQVFRQDFMPNQVANSSFEQISPVKVSDRSVENKVAPSSETLIVPSFSHVLDLVVSERRSSIEAVQHLHTLCKPTIQSPYPQSETQLPPIFRDSDVYPTFLSVKTSSEKRAGVQKDQVREKPLSSTDFSIMGLINPVSPCEVFVTSLINSDTDKDSCTELLASESGSDRATPIAANFTENDEDIRIIEKL